MYINWPNKKTTNARDAIDVTIPVAKTGQRILSPQYDCRDLIFMEKMLRFATRQGMRLAGSIWIDGQMQNLKCIVEQVSCHRKRERDREKCLHIHPLWELDNTTSNEMARSMVAQLRNCINETGKFAEVPLQRSCHNVGADMSTARAYQAGPTT